MYVKLPFPLKGSLKRALVVNSTPLNRASSKFARTRTGLVGAAATNTRPFAFWESIKSLPRNVPAAPGGKMRA